ALIAAGRRTDGQSRFEEWRSGHGSTTRHALRRFHDRDRYARSAIRELCGSRRASLRRTHRGGEPVVHVSATARFFKSLRDRFRRGCSVRIFDSLERRNPLQKRLGVAREANALWMVQVARNLSNNAEGYLMGKRYLIRDREAA